ncbi:acyl carrier protein [Streptomyces sp. SID486]|uniref:phosphopantetheine-binding protein n=1 Tax=unclassified Streptomyces TaxID=2593676 RepID=UPI001370A973|nr:MULTISPECIES: phosphopantetheine-binding protein [unclassified Streptomyces]MYW20218.1 acyl carrier protein [Streptomyces sp. SID2955]MYW45220.1 acyl carrier protein [Streptomyces sp. SID161]MYX94938.1 acyl carrier protein [Streptomyces sp. SID486]
MTTSTEARQRMTALVHEVVAQILPGLSADRITGDRHLRDLGADSVDRVEIILGLLQRLGLDTPMSRFSDVPDIDALVDVLLRSERG